MLLVQSRRVSLERIQQRYPDATILDVTSQGPQPWIRFSPFYPHKNIPVPLSPGWVSASVEGIWQGLKVFESADVDTRRFGITNMKGLKRTVRTYGRVLGHREGVNGQRLLGYIEARHTIYLPAYRWVLEHPLQELVSEIRELAQHKTVILLDYETNCDINDVARPLSHAGLISLYLEDKWPV